MDAESIFAPRRRLVASVLGPGAFPATAHPGLVWDRYLPVWKKDASRPERLDTLLQPLQDFVKGFKERGNDAGAKLLLQDLHGRQRRFLAGVGPAEKPGGGTEWVFKVQWRLALGLGLDHPTENGFVFDPLVGVPYLPGSAVKGLCHRQALLEKLEDQLDADTLRALFGSVDPLDEAGGESFARGGIVFLDAYPEAWPELVVDIVNCHHPLYYGGKSKGSVPRETEDPQPAFFLAVKDGTGFVFRLKALPGVEAARLLERAGNLLADALGTLGIGAKTAAGYGAMVPPRQDPTADAGGTAYASLRREIAGFSERDAGRVDALLTRLATLEDEAQRAELVAQLYAKTKSNKKAKDKLRSHPLLGRYCR